MPRILRELQVNQEILMKEDYKVLKRMKKRWGLDRELV